MSSSSDLLELETFLSGTNIPEIKPQPKTLLGIAKQPHYENVISNIYAFYFDVNEEHGLNDLFIRSLLELIDASSLGNQKVALQEFREYDIFTEMGTTGGGRIDLLLKNSEQAIIIENKVYHVLNNDLQDYWQHIPIDDKEKIGIVLSLYSITDTKHPQFINITHLDMVQKVTFLLGNYILEANHKYVIFLQDFIQNIINMSTKQADPLALGFYFKHLSQIREINDLQRSVYAHVVAEIEKAGNQMEGLNLWGPRANSELDSRVRYYVSPSNQHLMFAVVFDNVFDNKTLYIKIQLKNNLLAQREDYKSISLTDIEKKILNHTFYSDTNNSWSDFAIGEYKLEEEGLKNLSSFIQLKLKEDGLLSTFRKLEAVLPKK